MDEDLLFEVLRSDESLKISLSEVSLVDKVISFLPSVFKKYNSLEDLEMLSSTPDSTMEIEVPECSEDTEMLTSDEENNMELGTPEIFEDDKDSWKPESANKFSTKFKDFFNLSKKFESLSLKKVVNSHAIRKCMTLEELSQDYFIENYQYYEDLPYLELENNGNKETEDGDYVENSSEIGSTSIGKNRSNFDNICNTKDKNESEEEEMNNEDREKDEVMEDSKDNVDRKKRVADTEERESLLKYNLIMENGDGNMEINNNSYMKIDNSSIKTDNSNMEMDNSNMESVNSNMEQCNTDNSSTEDNRISIFRIAKKITTMFVKAMAGSYTEITRRF